jgi:hypothetical protein
MSNENNENIIDEMFVEELENINLDTDNILSRNSNQNIFYILESIDNNFSMLYNQIYEYNILERTYEEILEDNEINRAIIESENSYNSYKRKPECIINIKSLKFKDCKDNETICTICICEFTSEDKVSILKCNHIYHNKCIIEWGMYRQECPMCREKIEIKKVKNEREI